ncbi:MAG: NAD-dependent epimerase/dehydratase family protein [Planctomycetota bacterium]
MRVLLTGASGFIAWHLAQELQAANHEVIGLVRATSDTHRVAELGVELRVGDLSDEDHLYRAVQDCDAVVHLAGLTKAIDKRALYETNAAGTARLAQACSRLDTPPRLVYVSSLAAAGPSPFKQARNETDRPAPVSYYGSSKLAGEEALYPWAERLPCTVLRPPMVFGEGDPGMLAMFQALVRSRVHVIPGFRRKRYSVIHAADFAGFCQASIDDGETLTSSFADGEGIYFVESDQRFTYAQLGWAMGRALGHRLTVPLPLPSVAVYATGGFVDGLARLTGQAHYLSVDKAREATAGSWICCADKATQQLKLPLPTDVDARLKQTADWYREAGWL